MASAATATCRQCRNWSNIRDHILDVIADGDREKSEYILDWCAHMVQRPWEKPGVALVLKGARTG
jgi:hypothetical protein